MIIQQKRYWNLYIYLRISFIFNWLLYPLILSTKSGTLARVRCGTRWQKKEEQNSKKGVECAFLQCGNFVICSFDDSQYLNTVNRPERLGQVYVQAPKPLLTLFPHSSFIAPTQLSHSSHFPHGHWAGFTCLLCPSHKEPPAPFQKWSRVCESRGG